MIEEKFIDGFINDAEKVSSKNGNRYFIRGIKNNSRYVKHPKAEWIDDLWSNDFRNILDVITKKDKIFIHWYGLSLGKLILTIDRSIPLYVICWGGDFYEDPFPYHIYRCYDKFTLRYVKRTYIYKKLLTLNPKIFLKELWRLINLRKQVERNFELKKRTIQRINFLLISPYVTHEIDLIQKIYDIPRLLNKPFVYDQNFDIANELRIKKSVRSEKKIQIGNSATESNNHADCINVLEKFKNNNIKLIIPLSYGSENYADFVKRRCVKEFKNKCEFVEKFVPRKEYIQMLNEIDLAIMYHNRSQAFGNCVTLLTLGKKLYLKRNNPLWQLFQTVGIVVFDANSIKNLTFEEFTEPLTEDQIQSNIEKISNLFSEDKRLLYLKDLLN